MKRLIRIAVVVLAASLPAAAGADLRDWLAVEGVDSVRVNLNPWGPHLGFEVEIPGDDPRVEALLAVIRDALPGGDHRCSNAGAMRFRMESGRVVGVGLLPSHKAGLYALRLYDGDDYVAAWSVNRGPLLVALEALGVPMDDPAFRP